MPPLTMQDAQNPHPQTHGTHLNGLATIPRSHLVPTPPSASMDAVPLSLQVRDPSGQPVYEYEPPHAPQEQRPTSQPTCPPMPEASWPLQLQQPAPELRINKTRDPCRDGGEQAGHRQHHEMPPAVRQNAVSVNLPLRIGPRRDQSPGVEQPRGRSPSASSRPPTATMAPPVLLHPSSAQTQEAHPAPSAAGHGPGAVSQSASEVRTALSPTPAEQPQKRRSWFPGGNSRLRSKSHTSFAGTGSSAWVLSRDSRADYNVDYLVNGEKVPELWDDNGTLYVYLSPYQNNKGPSFKVPSSVIAQSRVLSGQVQSQSSSPASARSRARSFGGRDSLMAADAHRVATPTSPPPSIGSEARIYLPVERHGGTAPDLDRLVSLRNLFALLTGQPLVATRAFPTAFAALTQVAGLLREFEFSGASSSFGEAADVSIGFYVDQTGLADVRCSLDKTLEALLLGELLRFWPLYNEAFCHAVGKYTALRAHASPLWDKISPSTLQRLERAHLDLLTRQTSVNSRLEQFEFPSLFSGVGNSTSNPDYRNLRFKNWRSSFADMRSFALKHYKTQFGSWPPKASSKRNPFTKSGLNRLVLKILYADLCSVYDLLVDRRSITTRVGEDGLVSGVSAASSTAATTATAASAHHHTSDPTMMALRQILAEFDTSSPPVLPPIPFDVPKLPLMASVNGKFAEMAPRDQARFEKNIQPHDLQQLLLKSHNKDAERAAESPFLAEFEAFEQREAKGKSETELAEMRIGHWLFLYVVLQSLPMLVIDAPGLRFGDGTEYFLCEPPQGHPPWVEDAGEVRKAWFQTAGGAGPLVQLSADVLLYSVEATYHRSHCWLAAKKWDAEAGMESVRGSEGAFDMATFSIPSSVQPAPVSVPYVAPAVDSSHWPLSPAADYAPSPTAPSPQSQSAFDQGTGPRSRSTSPTTDGQWQGRPSPTEPLGQSSSEEQQQRARLRHASIGWKLEPVALPNSAVRQGSDSLAVGHDSRRVVSVNNLRALGEATGHADYGPGAPQAPGPERVSTGLSVRTSSTHAAGEFFNAESTFDSILGGMDDGRKKKKRSSFLPF